MMLTGLIRSVNPEVRRANHERSLIPRVAPASHDRISQADLIASECLTAAMTVQTECLSWTGGRSGPDSRCSRRCVAPVGNGGAMEGRLFCRQPSLKTDNID
jgi:hypothetical protein